MPLINSTPAFHVTGFLTKPAVLALACASVSLPSQADPINDTHLFRFGVYEQKIDVNASSVRDPFPETELDFDNILGLDESSTSFFLQYEWRFKEKWFLRAFYTNMEADGERKRSRPFNWNGVDYEAGLKLGTTFGVDTYLVAAEYAFLQTEKMELGAGIGLHAFDITTTIEIEATIDDVDGGGSVAGKGRKSKNDLLAPLPNLRLFGRYAFTPKWSAEGAVGWLSANYEDYEGDYLFLTLLTEYRITDRFGVGLAYQISEIDITHDRRNGSDTYDIDQYGPSIFISYGF